jgi:23S rRNA (pseudouridine1915-N3)-methyltransferase
MIKIVCVGKIKEKYLVDAFYEYEKRMSIYHKIKVVELKESNNKDLKHNLEEEGNAILANISSDEYVITLEILGTMLESTELASKISKLLTYGNTNITFVIGGSYGLSDSVKQRSNFALSFSKMTFPHQLMRVILIEQIYRSFTIINNKEYHK